jgi:DNA uptake protein ComE-like DNA-binding protein
VLTLLGVPTLSSAQEPQADTLTTDTTDVIQQLEPLLDNLGTTTRTSTQAAEQFADLRAHPLDLNQASAADLSGLPSVSLGDAHRIVEQREADGSYESVQGLSTVEGIGAATVRAVAPFLEVRPDASADVFPSVETILSTLTVSLTQRFGRQLDLGRGFREDEFLGRPGRLTTRLRVDHERRLQLALTLDKDPGEPVRWSPTTDTYGFDHVVGSLALRDLGPIETLVVGDFSAQFGQGVALWQGLRLGKGRDPVAPV